MSAEKTTIVRIYNVELSKHGEPAFLCDACLKRLTELWDSKGIMWNKIGTSENGCTDCE